jgi:hypothetical protein
VEPFERVVIDRLNMAFCKGAIGLLTWMGCENMEGRWDQTGSSNRHIDTG